MVKKDIVALRCYLYRDTAPRDDTDLGEQRRIFMHNKSIVLVFDTETTIDEYQNLLFGSCGIWVNGRPTKFYLFHADDLNESDIAVITGYAAQKGYEVLSRKEFVEKVFYPKVYRERAQCIGFNLPFDLSRLAIKYTRSRRYRSGFSLKLAEGIEYTRIVIDSLNSKAAFIEFTAPYSPKKKKYRGYYKGFFVDLRTAAFALTDESYGLATALEDFECEHAKLTPEGHGKITPEYIQYNINDTLATYELYLKISERYGMYNLDKYLNKLYSPASIGKAYLTKIGVKSFLDKNPTFPKEILGYVMTTYYGGRTEVHDRTIPVKVDYLDFTSMYPTVYSLLGMDGLLKAAKITFRDETASSQGFLDSIALREINNKETWQDPLMLTICKVVPDNDILPVRSHYGSKQTYNIGVNKVNSVDGTAVWYTMADLIASKLLSGKSPKIIESISFKPEVDQDGLKEIEVLEGIRVTPKEDFIQKLIEHRMTIKRQAESLKGDAQKQADLKQNILKIIANSTSYGIFIEINTKEQDETVKRFGLDSGKVKVSRTETEGSAFNPIMATFITAGARLIIASAEALIHEHGGHLTYCDTDSIFVSHELVSTVQQFFRQLNPYSTADLEMFKVETDENKKRLDNVWFYGISSKRYVLYGDGQSNERMHIPIRKYSSHGLGHLKDIDHEQWWKEILAVQDDPEARDGIISKYENRYAVSDLTISNYRTWSRFHGHNESKTISRSIKPFNFVTIGTGNQTDPETGKLIVPMIPFVPAKINGTVNMKIREVPFMPFTDYKSGKQYSENPEDYWTPLSEMFDTYRKHRESKFEGNTGQLTRSHITFDKYSIHYIGKETNELDESAATGVDIDYYTDYDDIDKTIKENSELILSWTPKDVVRFGIMKEVLRTLKRHVRDCTLTKVTKDSKSKVMNAIETYYRKGNH